MTAPRHPQQPPYPRQAPPPRGRHALRPEPSHGQPGDAPQEPPERGWRRPAPPPGPEPRGRDPRPAPVPVRSRRDRRAVDATGPDARRDAERDAGSEATAELAVVAPARVARPVPAAPGRGGAHRAEAGAPEPGPAPLRGARTGGTGPEPVDAPRRGLAVPAQRRPERSREQDAVDRPDPGARAAAGRPLPQRAPRGRGGPGPAGPEPLDGHGPPRAVPEQSRVEEVPEPVAGDRFGRARVLPERRAAEDTARRVPDREVPEPVAVERLARARTVPEQRRAEDVGGGRDAAESDVVQRPRRARTATGGPDGPEATRARDGAGRRSRQPDAAEPAPVDGTRPPRVVPEQRHATEIVDAVAPGRVAAHRADRPRPDGAGQRTPERGGPVPPGRPGGLRIVPDPPAREPLAAGPGPRPVPPTSRDDSGPPTSVLPRRAPADPQQRRAAPQPPGPDEDRTVELQQVRPPAPGGPADARRRPQPPAPDRVEAAPPSPAAEPDPADAPEPVAPAAPRRRRFGVLAWAALGLGAAGIVGSQFPAVHAVTAIVAGVGLVLAVIALFGGSRLLALLAVLVCLSGIAATVAAQEGIVPTLLGTSAAGPATLPDPGGAGS